MVRCQRAFVLQNDALGFSTDNMSWRSGPEAGGPSHKPKCAADKVRVVNVSTKNWKSQHYGCRSQILGLPLRKLNTKVLGEQIHVSVISSQTWIKHLSLSCNHGSVIIWVFSIWLRELEFHIYKYTHIRCILWCAMGLCFDTEYDVPLQVKPIQKIYVSLQHHAPHQKKISKFFPPVWE